MNTPLVRTKRFDLLGQGATLMIPLALHFINGTSLMWIFFAVGGWQICSFLLHFIPAAGQWKLRGRIAYGVALAALTFAGILCYDDTNAILPFLLILVMAGIILSVWYFILCTCEYIDLVTR